MSRATRTLIQRLTERLGPAVETPEWIDAGDGTLEPARYRVFRWCCAACHGGFDANGKLLLPPIRGRDDTAGHCEWLTCVFNLDPAHPITGGRREGLLGPEGHVVLYRAGATPIRFEPATKINTPAKLIETLSGG